MLHLNHNTWSRFAHTIYTNSPIKRLYRFTPSTIADLPDVAPDLAERRLIKRYLKEIIEAIDEGHGNQIDFIYIVVFEGKRPIVFLENITNAAELVIRRVITYNNYSINMLLSIEHTQLMTLEYHRDHTHKLWQAYDFLMTDVEYRNQGVK